MKNVCVVFLIFCIYACKYEQKEEKIKFVKQIYNLAIPSEKAAFEGWKQKSIIYNSNDTISIKYNSRKSYCDRKTGFCIGRCVFEDTNFEVYSGCVGEFGGTIIFRDKHTSKFYYLESLCLNTFDYTNGSYLITDTFEAYQLSRILKITDPRKLVEINPAYLSTDWKHEQFPNLSRDSIHELLFNQGESILDVTGFALNTYFRYKNKDFIVGSRQDTCYIAEIKHKKYAIIDTLLLKPTSSHTKDQTGSPHRMVMNNIYQGGFYRSSNNAMPQGSGAIYVKNDTIVICYQYYGKEN
jgi:hypothetical protein